MKKLPLYFSLIVAAAGSIEAETPRPAFVEGAVRQAQSVRQRQALAPKLNESYSDGQVAPELYPGESADVGPQLLVIPKVKKTWFEVSADAQYFYTSNIFLAEKAAVDTGVLLTTLQAAFAPTPFEVAGHELSIRAGYRHQRYNYGLDNSRNGLNNFDFDDGTVFANARYAFAPNWNVFVGVDYNRLLSGLENLNEFYTELVPGWALERQFAFGENSMLSVAYIGAEHITHADPSPTTNVNDRLDSIFSLSWSWQFRPGFVFQPYYRFQQTHYWVTSTRNDIFNTVGATISWVITDWASVRTFASWENRNSNDVRVSDYQKFDGGLGLSVVLHF